MVGRAPRDWGSWVAACGSQPLLVTVVAPIRCEDHPPGRQVEGRQRENPARGAADKPLGPGSIERRVWLAQSGATSSQHL